MPKYVTAKQYRARSAWARQQAVVVDTLLDEHRSLPAPVVAYLVSERDRWTRKAALYDRCARTRELRRGSA